MALCTMAVLLIAVSCKKGDKGDPGTANVLYSAWFTPGTYKKDTVFGSWGFSYTLPVPTITQTVLDTGSVLVFGKLLGYNPVAWPSNQVAQLPISVNYVQGGQQMDVWSALISPGNLRIRFVNNNNIYTSIANAHQFRYIIIPGGAPTGRRAQLTYSEICKEYNIPE